MSDEPPARSGSRWEPTDDGGEPTQPVRPTDPAAPEPGASAATVPATPTVEEPAAAAADPAGSPVPSWRDRVGRPAAAVAAAGLAAAVGVGGFAVGRAIGEDHRPAPTSLTREGGPGAGPGTGDGHGRPWLGDDGPEGNHDGGGPPGGRPPGGARPGGTGSGGASADGAPAVLG